jgi:hypothetical protein
MKRNNNRKRKQNKGNRNVTNQQLSNNVNLFQNKGVIVPLKSVIPIKCSAGLATGLYTFSAGSDVRFLAFGQILVNAPSPFSDFLSLYSEMRIKSLNLMLTPIRSTTFVGQYTSLFISVDPDSSTSPSNPTNNTVIDSPSSSMFDYNSISPKSVTYKFPGVGLGGNIWVSTSASIQGSIYIGNMVCAAIDSSNIWELVCNLIVEFRQLKTN